MISIWYDTSSNVLFLPFASCPCPIASICAPFHSVCVDDLRVSGQSLPLPPAVNTTSWGQVASWRGLEATCSTPDACSNNTCVAPLTCVSTMGVAACR